ncbi:MAG: methyltransferase domain-containing protein [Candidatus Dormibacteraeota bacterium]|nr:methyltransferase domain-containing protein [Candidatus Dormibacteraeota bacterium]
MGPVEGIGDQGIDPSALDSARALIDDFLAGRSERTVRSYRADLEEFARFQGEELDTAVADLLLAGPEVSGRILLDYGVDLARRGLAQATIDRRLTALRTMGRIAEATGFITWSLRPPTQDEVNSAIESSPDGDIPLIIAPRHVDEADRPDLLHYALQAVFGANYLAPVCRPTRVLDVGTGSGQWGFDLCQTFPEAQVVGLDLVAGNGPRHPRYRFVKGNLLHGLPFPDGHFDFVQQRLLVLGVPVASWPGVVADLMRVTRPGGWVELGEIPLEIQDAGPATERVVELTRRMAAAAGMDSGRVVFDSLDAYLREAGLVEVERREVEIPLGRWGGEAGALMGTSLRAGFARLCDRMQRRGRLTAELARELVQACSDESAGRRMSIRFVIAFGRKAAD